MSLSMCTFLLGLAAVVLIAYFNGLDYAIKCERINKEAEPCEGSIEEAKKCKRISLVSVVIAFATMIVMFLTCYISMM